MTQLDPKRPFLTHTVLVIVRSTTPTTRISLPAAATGGQKVDLHTAEGYPPQLDFQRLTETHAFSVEK